jgi:hypothetical protein
VLLLLLLPHHRPIAAAAAPRAVDLYDLVDLASEGGSYTDIEVGALKEEVAAQLGDNFKIRAITSEVRGGPSRLHWRNAGYCCFVFESSARCLVLEWS